MKSLTFENINKQIKLSSPFLDTILEWDGMTLNPYIAEFLKIHLELEWVDFWQLL